MVGQEKECMISLLAEIRDLLRGGDRWYDKTFTYNDTTVQKEEFNFVASHLIIHNISANDIEYTFDKSADLNTIPAGDKITLDNKKAERIYIRLTTANDSIRVRAW